jgi:hypothetical protein
MMAVLAKRSRNAGEAPGLSQEETDYSFSRESEQKPESLVYWGIRKNQPEALWGVWG